MSVSAKSTKTIAIDADKPDVDKIEEAAEILRADGLVAFPTETVYGLGARALSATAVAGIFEAKGRPATNPLIVHIAHIEEARDLAAKWPESAEELARTFWPGPLTLVVRRASHVPDAVCAGLDTVAIRMPAHPVARALIEAVGEPLAAPSANRYTQVSPTTAEHVQSGLDGRVDLIIDGGPTSVGLESTLVSLVEDPPAILRPGMIDGNALADVVELADAAPGESLVVDDAESRPSPGLSAKHYAPGVPLKVVDTAEFRRRLARSGAGRAFVGIAGDEMTDGGRGGDVIYLPASPADYARRIYAILHRFDRPGVDEIIVEMPPAGEEWEAIRDRLSRAGS